MVREERQSDTRHQAEKEVATKSASSAVKMEHTSHRQANMEVLPSVIVRCVLQILPHARTVDSKMVYDTQTPIRQNIMTKISGHIYTFTLGNTALIKVKFNLKHLKTVTYYQKLLNYRL